MGTDVDAPADERDAGRRRRLARNRQAGLDELYFVPVQIDDAAHLEHDDARTARLYGFAA